MAAPTFTPEFDHVYVIDAQGNIQMDSPLLAPDVELFTAADISVTAGWSVLTGHTRQHGYRGAVMHPSEQWGAWAIDDLTERAQDGPVAFAVVEVRDTDGDFPEGDPIGWAVAYRVLNTEPTQRTPEQIADDIAALPEFASLTDEDLGRSVEAMIVRGIETDRAQHTPEQIAHAVAAEWIDRPGADTVTLSVEDFRSALAQAIARAEADRAQRGTSFAEIDQMLNAWENYDGDVSGFIEAWVDHLNDGDDLPDWATA